MFLKIKMYAMLIVKAIVGLFPKGFKNWLKKSPYLTSLYSRNLQRSGLFYGFPSRKVLERLYLLNLNHQNQQFKKYPSSAKFEISVLILTPPQLVKYLSKTLHSLTLMLNAEIFVTILTDKNSLNSCVREAGSYKGLFSGCDCITQSYDIKDGSILAIYSGVSVHESLSVVIANEIDDELDILYFDTDTLSEGKRISPRFYPDWNPDLHLSTGFIRFSSWFKSSQLLKGSQYIMDEEGLAATIAIDYLNNDLLVKHIPLVLGHSGIFASFSMKHYRSLLENVKSEDAKISLSKDKSHLCWHWKCSTTPLVSLVIPTKNGKELVKECIESILEKTSYSNYEILLVDNNSDDDACLRYFDELALHPKIVLLKYPHEFNYSAINNFAVSHAKGELVGLVNNDIEVESNSWLTDMVGHVMRKDVGCVGAKLLYSDGRIQHAGVVMGYGGGAGHAHKYFPRYHSGYLNRLAATGNYSAVTAACLLVKKQDYYAVGGLDESLKVAFNDVDFCLKVLKLGRRNVYCAEAELFHHESISRGYDDTDEKRIRFISELTTLKTRWSEYIDRDPAYNINLTLSRENFSIKDTLEN